MKYTYSEPKYIIRHNVQPVYMVNHCIVTHDFDTRSDVHLCMARLLHDTVSMLHMSDFSDDEEAYDPIIDHLAALGQSTINHHMHM